jgi:hypothetical protein
MGTISDAPWADTRQDYTDTQTTPSTSHHITCATRGYQNDVVNRATMITVYEGIDLTKNMDQKGNAKTGS